ncbi:MAG: aminopeptidase P family protein [Candidatus Izimaplasma sp.]|nr:aminopeptidase P family protein [Candidatus Izimaplasma bacterium]
MVDKLIELFKEQDYDAILLTGLENPKAALNLRYITKYTGSFGIAVITEEKQFFLTDFRYRDQVQMEVPTFEFVEISGNYIPKLEVVIKKNNIKKLGFDKNMRFSEYELYKKLPCELVPMDELVESLREAKTKQEIETLKIACQITDEALEETLSEFKLGMTERDLEIKLKNKMIEKGADKTWDRFIVASGARGAMPHGMATDKVIKKGELVTFDIGCWYDGYSSDLTRTVAVGKISAEQTEIYQVVKDAQALALNKAKAGMTGKELDAVARDYIEKEGYGDYFKHGLGHGLGLNVHEGPRVSKTNDKPLKEGACVTIEPGIYITNFGGVRIEDDVILTKDGCTILNAFPKTLINILND